MLRLGKFRRLCVRRQQVRLSAGGRGGAEVRHRLFVSGAAECSDSGVNHVGLLKRQERRCDCHSSVSVVHGSMDHKHVGGLNVTVSPLTSCSTPR